MSDTESTPPADSGSSKPSVDVGAALKALPRGEKLLGAAAIVLLVAYIASDPWHLLFNKGVFVTAAFLGIIGVLALIALPIFGVKLMSRKTNMVVLVLLGVVPFLGWLVDGLLHFWQMLLILGSMLMAYFAIQIAKREGIIKAKVTKT